MSLAQIQPRYTVTLSDVQQLAQLVSLADDLKNYVPPECEIASEAAIAVNRAHNLLQRVLGEDVARIVELTGGASAPSGLSAEFGAGG